MNRKPQLNYTRIGNGMVTVTCTCGWKDPLGPVPPSPFDPTEALVAAEAAHPFCPDPPPRTRCDECDRPRPETELPEPTDAVMYCGDCHRSFTLDEIEAMFIEANVMDSNHGRAWRRAIVDDLIAALRRIASKGPELSSDFALITSVEPSAPQHEGWAAFQRSMKGRAYGRDALLSAWAWFKVGWAGE